MLFKTPLSQQLLSFFRRTSPPLEQKRSTQLTVFISVLFGILAFIHFLLVVYIELYSLAAVFVFYIALLLVIIFLTSRGYYKSAKFTFSAVTILLFSSLSYFLGIESNIHWVLISMIITPNILFSYSNLKELSLSLSCQALAIIAFLINHTTYHYAKYSFNYAITTYIEYSSISILIITASAQIFYLLYIVNSKEKKLNMALTQIISYKTALDAASIVAYTDKYGIITQVNDNFCKISGYQTQELIGKNHRILRSGIHTNIFYKNLWETISSGKIWRGEICNKNKDGELYWVDSSISPIYNRDNNIEGYLSIRFDITSKKNAEAQLVHSAKLSSLGELAAGVAHEINTPLSIIQMRTEQLTSLIENVDESPDREKLRKYANTIDATTKRISKIIYGFRSFARDSKHDDMEPYAVSDIVQETLELCLEKIKVKSIQCSFISTEDVLISCRPSEVSQVLLNLLNNSVDAIENLANKWIKIELKVLTNNIELSVTDSGRAIPKELRTKMMQPFFTTKAPGKGTGIGLSISRGIVISHGGEMLIDEKCPNTRFIIKLPLTMLTQ